MVSEEKFIMADGCAVRVKDSGSGSYAVVLLHGYLESLEVWDDFQAELSKSVRVISLDLPGHGVSEIKGNVHTMEFLADTVYAVMRRLGVDRAVVVGHSMGGYAALELLGRHPEAMEGIVLFHSGPNADSESKREERYREMNLILSGKKELIARLFPQVGFAPQNRKRLADKIEELAEQIVLTEDEGIVALLKGMGLRKDHNDILRASDIPQSFIFGKNDYYIPLEYAETVAASHPQAEVVWLEESGHMGFLEQPAESAAAILGFCEKVRTGAAAR